MDELDLIIHLTLPNSTELTFPGSFLRMRRTSLLLTIWDAKALPSVIKHGEILCAK